MPEITQSPRSDDFDQDADESIKKWDYKNLVFYAINRFQQESTRSQAGGDESNKINNLFIAVDHLYILCSPCIDKVNRLKAEGYFTAYQDEEQNLIRRSGQINPQAFGIAIISNRHRYIRAIHQLIIDSLQSQGLLLRKETRIKAGSSRPVLNSNRKKSRGGK